MSMVRHTLRHTATVLVLFPACLLLVCCATWTPPGLISADSGAELFVTSEIDQVSADSSVNLYRARWGRRIFTDQRFSWATVPDRFRGGYAVSTTLEREAPLRVRFETSGFVYAVLWKWDYGFLPHLPETLGHDIEGWHLVEEDAARVSGAPEPFRSLSLYRMPVAAGVREIPVRSYVGQWVIVGFEQSDEAVVGSSVGSPRIAGALTRHNVVRPSTEVTVSGVTGLREVRIYRNGEPVSTWDGPDLTTPQTPGRYALHVVGRNGTATIPMTVGFPLSDAPGWEPSFFPIHFYTGWGYTGVFQPNPAMRRELEILAMVELGANTFFVSRDEELLDALGVRRILNVRRDTRYIAREIDDTEAVAQRFRYVVDQLEPFDPSVLGLYVEDEPPETADANLRIFEAERLAVVPGIELLYTIHGAGLAQRWNEIGTTTRMVRSYPIRKRRRRDIVASVMDELAGRLSAAQTDSGAGRLWLVAQSFGDLGIPCLWDLPTPTQMRLMINLSLGRGMRALTYFCFDSSPRAREWLVGLAVWPFVPQSDLYEEVGRLNRRIADLAPVITELEWIKGVATSDPMIDVQLLRHGDESEYVWITNLDTTNGISAEVDLGELSGPVAVTLDAGDGILLPLR
jgi:hypothetical protein